MKTLFSILLSLLACQLILAQSVPQTFSYQAVARDAGGVILANENLTIRLSVLDGPGGSSLFSERHSVQTNDYGHFQVNVGEGVGQTGTLDPQGWLASPALQVEIANGFNQTTGFSIVGTVPLQSVPYATVADFAFNGKLTKPNEAEYLHFSGSNGALNATIDGNTYGVITVNDPNGDQKVSIRSEPTIQGVGVIQLGGPNSNNIELSVISPNCPDNGAIAVRDINGAIKAQLYADCNGTGVVAVNGVKPFFMDHPTQPGKEIWYCAIEGPEAAAYQRGTATLVNGEAEITFPEHFQLVANPNTMTITTSPWSADSKGLAVVERTATGFRVKELFGGTGNYQFDWRVEAKRKGYEGFQVVRDKADAPLRNQE